MRDITGDHGAGTDHGPVTNGDALENHDDAADPRVFADRDRAAILARRLDVDLGIDSTARRDDDDVRPKDRSLANPDAVRAFGVTPEINGGALLERIAKMNADLSDS